MSSPGEAAKLLIEKMKSVMALMVLMDAYSA